jgi:sigma-B regulation protein RsbQ
MAILRTDGVALYYEVHGEGPAILGIHGTPSSSLLWADAADRLSAAGRCVIYDRRGFGRSDKPKGIGNAGYDYDTLADDLHGLITELDLHDVTLVAHSVSTMMAVLAAVAEPERFRQLVLVAPNPYFLDDPATGYAGGFSADDLAEVAAALDSNYFTWAEAFAPVIMGVPEAPELGEELTASFCRADPEIARQFAKATFLSDNRDDLARVTVPTLVVECAHDAIAPRGVGAYVHSRIPGSRLVTLDATGHCPQLSAPEATAEAVRSFLPAVAAPG